MLLALPLFPLPCLLFRLCLTPLCFSQLLGLPQGRFPRCNVDRGQEAMEEAADWGGDTPEGQEGHKGAGDKGPGEEETTEQPVKRRRMEEGGGDERGVENVTTSNTRAPAPNDEGRRQPEGREKTKEELNEELMKRAEEYWGRAPERVKEAAKKSKDMGEFKKNRAFTFLHLFSGPFDHLAKAIIEGAGRAGLEVRCRSLDIKLDLEHNLKDADKWKELGEEVDRGDYDGSHGGFPCGSFSRVRWRQAKGFPPPVRSLQHPYGLPSNNPQQQREADVGTLMATWTTSLMERQIESQKNRGIPEVATVENPPGSETMFEGPAWALPEIKEIMERIEAHAVEFNTCAFMSKAKTRFFKPAKWAGRLDGIKKINRVCKCPAWVTHKPAVEGASVEAGVYPEELCNENLEFWRYQLVMKKEKVSELQRKWLANEEGRMERLGKNKVDVKLPEKYKELGEQNPALQTDNTEENVNPRSNIHLSAKEVKELEDKFYVGGMRNPKISVERSWKMKEAGRRIREAWNRFRRRTPEAMRLGEKYGTPEATFDEEVARAWKNELIVLLDAVVTKARKEELDEYQFKSPLDPKLWRAWADVSGDPDRWISRWAEDGVPLGMAKDIPPSEGVFPPSKGKEAVDDCTPELEEQVQVVNYKSVRDFPEDASIEVERLIKAGFAKKIQKKEAAAKFGEGTVSKLALLIKQKSDNTVKRRVIVDMKRSGGNDRASCPERIVLPRIQDVTGMGQDLAKRCVEVEEATWNFRRQDRSDNPVIAQLITFDLKDAFCHFGLDKAELKHSLAPLDEENYILFSAMLFGFKSAPLIMGRLSAAVGRLWQSLMEAHEAQVQIYIDDLLMMARGTASEINSLVAMGLYTLKAFGVMFSLSKGERGSQLKWIGVQILLNWAPNMRPGELMYSVPKQAIEEVRSVLVEWEQKGMIPLKELRSVTGRLSWIAGIAPRIRWAVSVFYAVVAAAERDEREGKEEQRAGNRDDKRTKRGLVAVKRLGIARAWLMKVLKYNEAFLLRSVRLEKQEPTWAVITDACPTGYGGILAAIQPGQHGMIMVQAYTASFTTEEAKLLQVDFGQSSSQGALEALAVMRAVRIWGTKMYGKAMLIRSDSVVALGMAKKLSSPAPTVNFLGGELAMNLEFVKIETVVAQHIPGKLNDLADWLSRHDARKEEPPKALREVDVLLKEPLTVKDFYLPPPGVSKESWGEVPHHGVAVFHNL